RIGELETADIKLEAFAQSRIARLPPRQRRERQRIIVKDGRRADPEIWLDAVEKDPEEQRLPIVTGMRRDVDPDRRRGEPLHIGCCWVGGGRQDIDPGVTLESRGNGQTFE